MDSKTKTGIIVISIIVIIIGGLFGWVIWQQNQPGKLDGFANCLKEKGTIFYGAFWCSHCQNQKILKNICLTANVQPKIAMGNFKNAKTLV